MSQGWDKQFTKEEIKPLSKKMKNSLILLVIKNENSNKIATFALQICKRF